MRRANHIILLAVFWAAAASAPGEVSKPLSQEAVFQKTVDPAALMGTNTPARPGGSTNNATLREGTAGLRDETLKCGNWIYAGSKSSVCFSPKFLETVKAKTTLEADVQFTPVRLGSRDVFSDHPFAIMTGEGSFTLQEEERKNMKDFLTRGGFLLASAGCSSTEWAQSFRREIARVFPDKTLKPIPMDHAMFRTVYDIKAVTLKHGGTTLLQGLEIDGRIVLVYTPEGLNDTGNVSGCCCCGGNEIKNSQDINVNIFTYATMH